MTQMKTITHDRDTMVGTVAHDDITLTKNGERIIDSFVCMSETCQGTFTQHIIAWQHPTPVSSGVHFFRVCLMCGSADN